jgi:hypothetical protein
MSRLLKESWLDAFLKYTDNTEIPRSWLTWSAISAVSASLKRRVFTWYRGIEFYPNQYIILVGPPGIGKGEAINAALDITNAANSVNYLSDWNTPQEMIDEIATGFTRAVPGVFLPGQPITGGTIVQDRTACLLAKELPVMLQSYDNLHSLLCAWWDQHEFVYKTKNKGKYKITEMCISMLGGCVPDYIRSLSKDRLAPITGGFTARTMFIYETEKYQLLKSNFGKPVQVVDKLKDDLTNDLKHICTLQGELHFDQEAKKLWESKYIEHNANGNFDSDASANFKSRISSHIVKTAITISVCETDNLIITRDHLERAIKLVEQVRDKVDIVFRSIGESPIAVSQERVLSFVQMKGITNYKEILKFNYRHVTNEQLNIILTVLEYAGKITVDIQGNQQIVKDTNTIMKPKGSP